ncbi:hypothetical protein VNI00_014382 [Paramarasmius palmivorus]|uniref:Dynactin subunit 2 n=1 Tax=Paramarasmius palmivorus TaxID=297713 RepID=A0AAW0BSU3_9AGAR
MSVNKYANLPDIDTAQDVYETEDVVGTSQTNRDSSDDEGVAGTATVGRSRGSKFTSNPEELDSSNLINAEEASRRFRRAERRREHAKTHYVYPDSGTDTPSSSEEAQRSLTHRLKALQAELQSLEAELEDPSNPRLEAEDVDPGELIRGLVDVRRRLDRVRKDKEGRGRLVGVLLGQNQKEKDDEDELVVVKEEDAKEKENDKERNNLAEIDKRTTPLPPPLLPQITRLSAQLGVLTQPRHIDAISRRLKLLLSELDRTRPHPSASGNQQSPPSTTAQTAETLHRLAPSLPQIPHILMRLRTLSALHTSANEFADTLSGLEEEQVKARERIGEMEVALEKLEKNLEENREVVKGNVKELEERVSKLTV